MLDIIQLRESVRHLVQESTSDSEYLAAVEAGNTEKCQQMVDEAAKSKGYNVGPVYHGTDREFRVFNPLSHFGTRSAARGLLYGRGADDTGWVGSFFLRVNRSLVIEDSEESANPAEYVYLAWRAGVFSEGEAKGISASDHVGRVLSRALQAKGYDSIEYVNSVEDPGSTSYVILDPSQTKSADPVTYDDSKQVIPLSQRFNPSSDDIRY